MTFCIFECIVLDEKLFLRGKKTAVNELKRFMDVTEKQRYYMGVIHTDKVKQFIVGKGNSPFLRTQRALYPMYPMCLYLPLPTKKPFIFTGTHPGPLFSLTF